MSLIRNIFIGLLLVWASAGWAEEYVDEAQVADVEISEADLEPPADWEVVKQRVIDAVTPHLSGFLEKAGQTLLDMDEDREAFLKEAKAGAFVAEIPSGVGIFELNVIEGEPVVRAVHSETGLSLLYVRKGKVASDSAHLRQWVSRQHIHANHQGRDVVILWREGDQIVGSEYRPRWPLGSREWWADFYYATVKKPDKGDYVLSSMCAIAYAGVASCVASLPVLVGASESIDVAPIAVSAVYGAVMGAGVSTMRQWSLRGSHAARVAKMSVPSTLFNYSIAIWQHGFSTVFRFSDPQSILLNLQLMGYTVLSNVGRAPWAKIGEFRERYRKADRSIDVEFFGVKTEMSRASFEDRMIYTVPLTLKLMGMLGVGLQLSIPFTGISPDIGILLQLAAIPLAQKLMVDFAERHQLPDAPELRAQLNEMKPHFLPKKIYNFLKEAIAEWKSGVLPLVKATWKENAPRLYSTCVQWIKSMSPYEQRTP